MPLRIVLLFFPLFLNLPPVLASREYASVADFRYHKPFAIHQKAQGKVLFSILIDANVEARVIHRERFKEGDWFYVDFMNGFYRGRRGWVPYDRDSINLYGLEKSQAFQVLEPERAVFVRTLRAVTAKLAASVQAKDMNRWDYIYIDPKVDFFSMYPPSNFGVKEIQFKEQLYEACPNRPLMRSGKPCRLPEASYKLPKHLKKVIYEAARRYDIHPAILAVVIHKESHFNPFAENEYEKSLCLKRRREKRPCASYRWGQGLGQLGATNAAQYGLVWQKKMHRPKVCRKGHIFKWSCYADLEKKCAKRRTKEGLYPIYCPRAGIFAIAKHIHILMKERFIAVKKVSSRGIWQRSIVDVTKHMRRNLAEEFRYIAGMLNRGMRPVNSVEEHYRQHGKPPKWYGNAWITDRKGEDTPSVHMGYHVLHKELINRCHVWQIAGLCGESLGGTLAGQYLKEFPKR